MAKNSFTNQALKKKTDAAWNFHAKAFHSLMKSIFIGNETARAQFVSALDLLSEAKAQRAAEILENQVKPLCKTAEEKTAYLYFSAFAYEMLQRRSLAYSYLKEALQYEPQSFRVYYKVASYAYAEGMFGLAEENFKRAIACMEENPSEPTKDYARFLSITYCKLSLSQTMMHRYDEAEKALLRSEEIASPLPEREHAKAVLYAARGERERVKMCLGLLALEDDSICWEKANDMTKEILSGQHPQFSKLPVDAEEIERFWFWFAEKFAEYQPLFAKKAEIFAKEISEKLRSVFPFFRKKIEVFIDDTSICTFFFPDYYAASLSFGLDALLGKLPDELRGCMRTVKIH